MKKKIAFILASILLTSFVGWAQTPFTATYTFTGTTGNVTSFAYNGDDVSTGITMGNLEKTGVTSSSSTSNFRANNWPLGAISGSDAFTGSLDAGKYFGFTVTAAAGYKFTITSITFGIGRSSTGIRQSEWRGSADAYTSTLSNYTSLNAGMTNTAGVLTNPDLNSSWTGNVLDPGASYVDVTTSAGFRFFMYNAEASGGTAGLQGPITISGTYELAGPPAPTITFSPAALTGITYVDGSGPSSAQSLSVGGSNLTNNIIVTPETNYEISLDNSTFQTTAITLIQAAGSVASTVVYVRLKAGLAIGSYNANIVLTSTGVTDKTVACSGTVTAPIVIPNAWINEIHYDNFGTDVDEFIEVAVYKAGDYNLADFSVILYNGNGGTSYDTKTLDLFSTGDIDADFSFFYYVYPVNGIQNGDPDGMALVWNGNVIQFLSYEGTFTATDGPALGMTTTDIGVAQGTEAAGMSLQLIGQGSRYHHFTWIDPPASPGNLNASQVLTAPIPVPFNWKYIAGMFILIAGVTVIRKFRF